MCVISKPISHQELETIAIVASSLITTVVNDEIAKKGSNRTGTTTIKRQRVEVEDIFDKLGLTHSRRAYRMRTDSFYKLHKMLYGSEPNIKRRKSGKVVNGAISSTAKLSMALRLFAGGDKADIGLVHGVHTNEPYRAMWEIVDLVNSCEDLKIKFPSHEEQKIIAEGFRNKSTVKFGNCVGCIDGMLVWCNKFSDKDLHGTMIGPMKFLNDREL